jgi:peptidylprolyl isomerase
LSSALAFIPTLALAAGSAVSSAPSSTGDVVAQAGSITLGGSDIRTLVADLPSSERTAATSNLNSLEQVVHADLVGRAVLAEAKASGFDHQPDTIAQLDRVRDEALVRLWVASKAVVPAGYPSEADIQAAYNANRKAFVAPTQYRIGQIFISAPDGGDPAKLAAAVRKAADVGSKIATADFSKLAQEQSDDPESASRGGDLGYLPENRMRPEILAAVRGLKPGQVIGPVKTAQGLHFLKLLDEKPGAALSLAQVHDGLAAALRNRRASEVEQAYLKDYNAKLDVTVNQIELAKLLESLPR